MQLDYFFNVKPTCTWNASIAIELNLSICFKDASSTCSETMLGFIPLLYVEYENRKNEQSTTTWFAAKTTIPNLWHIEYIAMQLNPFDVMLQFECHRYVITFIVHCVSLKCEYNSFCPLLSLWIVVFQFFFSITTKMPSIDCC